MPGLTPEGFSRKRLPTLLEEINDETKVVFGENFNVSPESASGQINGVVSESNALLWEIAEKVYNAFNPKASSGASLSNLVQLNGITRLPATKSRAEMTLTGVEGTTIPEDSIISTSNGDSNFLTEEEVTIGVGGSVTVYAVASIVGLIQAAAGTIVNIETPISGWEEATNVASAIPGTEEETDVQLRSRRERSVSRTATSVIGALYGEVSNVPNVTAVRILENVTNEEDGNGLPPHSFQTIVSGGSDENIARAIWVKKPAGILTFGEIPVEVVDEQGIPHIINFSRPEEVEIYVLVRTTASIGYPVNGDKDMKTAIVEYSEDGGFGLSQDVVVSRLYTPVNSIPNHDVDIIQVALFGENYDAENIQINADQIAKFDVSRIIIQSS